MYKIFATVVRVLWKIGLLGTIRLIFPHPVFYWLTLLTLFVLFDLMIWQSLGQIFGSIYTRIAHRFNLPSKDNYTCKGEYILPMTGKWTVVNGSVDKKMSHSWGIVNQRYAYDFIIVDDTGKSCGGNNKSVNSYYCYGKDIISPADGVVVQISGKHKDSRTNGRKAYCDSWDIRGNFIVIKHADKEYSLTAHLASDSITVAVGDKVKQGDIIAKCGNTGNTSEPHIHFQLQSGKSFFASAGLPIAFSHIYAGEKTPYWQQDKRIRQTEPENANGSDKVFIGRGLEVENLL